jgi:hypothetical protein
MFMILACGPLHRSSHVYARHVNMVARKAKLSHDRQLYLENLNQRLSRMEVTPAGPHMRRCGLPCSF